VRTRDHYIMKDETIPDSGTIVKDITLRTPIQEIIITMSVTVGAADYDDHPLHQDVKKIEITDGGATLYSLSMIQNQALNAFHHGRFPLMDTNTAASAVNTETAIISFGRTPNDLTYMFDSTKFTNPQLKITYSFGTGAGQWASGTAKATIMARTVMDPPSPPTGFLSAKEVWSATLGTSGERRVELPTDYPYRMMLIRGYYPGERVDEDITKVKLSCDADAYIPFEIDGDDINTMMISRWGYFEDTIKAKKQDGEIIYARLQDVKSVPVINAMNDWNIASYDALDAEQVTLQLLLLSATPTIAKDTTDRDVVMKVQGIQPHGCYGFMFGDGQDETQFFPATEFKSIFLVLTLGGSGAAGSVVLQQLRTY